LGFRTFLERLAHGLEAAIDLATQPPRRGRSEQAADQLATSGAPARLEITGTEQRRVVTAALAGVGRVGLEAEHVSWAAQRRYAGEWFPDQVVVATSGLVERLRRHKDEGELARMAAAAEVADAALAEMRPRLLDGPTASAHAHPISEVTGLQAALDASAPLASPALTGTPTAPTAIPGTNTTQLATTAFVAAAVAALINGAPGALDTLNELASALGSDANFSTTITNALASKLAIASNLADLANVATARTNLGLGSMALQASNNVSITGGSVDGITLDGGTF